jgi:hypothetical protein
MGTLNNKSSKHPLQVDRNGKEKNIAIPNVTYEKMETDKIT